VVVKKELLRTGPKRMQFQKFLKHFTHENWYLSNYIPQEMMHELHVSRHTLNSVGLQRIIIIIMFYYAIMTARQNNTFVYQANQCMHAELIRAMFHFQTRTSARTAAEADSDEIKNVMRTSSSKNTSLVKFSRRSDHFFQRYKPNSFKCPKLKNSGPDADDFQFQNLMVSSFIVQTLDKEDAIKFWTPKIHLS